MEIICFVIYTNLIICNPDFLFKLITYSQALLILTPARSIIRKKELIFAHPQTFTFLKNSHCFELHNKLFTC